MRTRIRHTRDFLGKLGGRAQCPACLERIRPGQKTTTHQGRLHHKRCVVYERAV